MVVVAMAATTVENRVTWLEIAQRSVVAVGETEEVMTVNATTVAKVVTCRGIVIVVVVVVVVVDEEVAAVVEMVAMTM